jgi:hypothetical protein
MDHVPEFKFLANQIIKSDYDPTDACLTASKFFLSSLSSHPVSSPTFLQDYLHTQYKCLEFTNKLQANILCSFCSPRFAQTINLQTKKIYLQKNSCETISINCKDAIVNNLSKLYPFLRMFEPLTRCSIDGELNNTQVPLMINSEGSIDTSIGEELTPDQCNLAVNFGIRLNYNSEGEFLFVKSLYRRARRYFKILGRGESSGFRVLEKGMTRFEAVQRFEELVIPFGYKKWKELRGAVVGEREKRTLEPLMKWLESGRGKLDGWLLPPNKLLKELKELNLVYPRNKE